MWGDALFAGEGRGGGGELQGEASEGLRAVCEVEEYAWRGGGRGGGTADHHWRDVGERSGQRGGV